jgi:uncharacterized protein
MADSAGQSAKSETTLATFAQRHPLTLFFILAYVWTWLLWLVMAKTVPDGNLSPHMEAFFEALFATSAFGPTVAALVTSWLAYRNLRICRLWTGWPSLIQGLAFGLTTFFIATLVAPVGAIAKAPLTSWHWSALLHCGTYQINFSTFFGGPVNEEPGWRGFALPRLQRRYGPVLATLILAPLWAAWHAPLFWMQGWTSAAPWEYVLILVGIAFLFTATANIAKFNVIVAMVLHAFFNTSSQLGNSLSAGIARRPHEILIYTFVVLSAGLVIGLATLAVWGSSIKQKDALEIADASAQFVES